MNDRHENPTHMSDQRKRSVPSAGQAKGHQGRYLKQKSSTAQRRRRRRRKINPRFVVMLAVLLAILIGIAVAVRSCAKPDINGRWDLDGTTVYEFDKDGKGALVLMLATYEFEYEIEDDVLIIDFVDENALDAKYTFKIEKDMLFLTGGPGDAKVDYILRRLG